MSVKVNKAKRNLTREELDVLPRVELVEMIVKLEAHNLQLKNILEKKVNPRKDAYRRKETDRAFNFDKFHKRHILLKFFYLGWDYEGFVVQVWKVYLSFELLRLACLAGQHNRDDRTLPLRGPI